MQQLLKSQYELVKSARHALFTYCKSMSQNDLFKKVDTFNDNCIIDLLVHNVNTYISWIGNLGLDAGKAFYNGDDIKNFDEIEQLFAEVDQLVSDFLEKYKNNYEQPFAKTLAHKGIDVTVTPLQLFTHVITHEFHHKGQMLTMSRMLGYTPVDTDAIRF
jgi:uncharacterized damage-inducible protein DinB